MAKDKIEWRNRIVGYGEEQSDQLPAHEGNWRIHPKNQQDVLSGVLDEVGWVQNVIVNKRLGDEWGKDRGVETIVDGHLRVALAISRGESVPVTYVNLTPSEEALVLATIDPISAMAATDRDQLDALLRDVSTSDTAVMEMLSQLATDNGIVPSDTLDGNPVDIPEQFQILIECSSEEEQAELLNRFIDEGLKCRALIS